MRDSYDLKKHAILYVDDEEMSLKNFSRAFSGKFRILTAANAQDGLKLFEAHQDEIGLLMTDQRMPGEKGVWLLERVRQLRPRVIRILATAYSDMDAAIEAVNTGAIYKYITKPWDPAQLDNTLVRGLEFFMVQRERDELLREKISVLRNAMVADRILSLGLLAAGMSHHIRNSLVAVKTFLDLAPDQLKQENIDLSGLKNPDFWRDYHGNVQGQIKKINQLLSDLWSASEKKALSFADEIRLRGTVTASIAAVTADLPGRKVVVENQLSDLLPVIKGDAPQIQRLFDLLLRDEIESLPEGSRVVVSGEAAPDAPSEQVVITVSDNGPGLTRESLRVLFDPFTPRTGHPGDHGINLMACYFIVHHHGGRIEAQSESGTGTRFRIHLPVNPTAIPVVEEGEEFFQRLLSVDDRLEKILAAG